MYEKAEAPNITGVIFSCYITEIGNIFSNDVTLAALPKTATALILSP